MFKIEKDCINAVHQLLTMRSLYALFSLTVIILPHIYCKWHVIWVHTELQQQYQRSMFTQDKDEASVWISICSYGTFLWNWTLLLLLLFCLLWNIVFATLSISLFSFIHHLLRKNKFLSQSQPVVWYQNHLTGQTEDQMGWLALRLHNL